MSEFGGGGGARVTTARRYIKGATGESAYEIAVRNGFVGTEGEWIISLHGGPNVVSIPYDEWPPLVQEPNTLYLREAP